jgi:hypothetical protein
MISASHPQDKPEQTRERLEAMRLRLQRAITSYPTPIPACDADFNHLLEQRALVCDELSRLREDAAAPKF